MLLLMALFFWIDKKRNTIRYHQRIRQFLWSSLLYPLFLWMYIFDPLWFVLLRYCTTNIHAILRVLTTGGNSVLTRAKKFSLPTYTGYSSYKQDPYLYEEKYYKSSHDCCLRRTNGLVRARRTKVLSTLSFVYFFGLQAKSPIRG